MSSEFRELVNMYANQGQMIQTLRDELAKSEEARTQLYRELQAQHDENRSLRADVGAALHGRVKGSPDQCNEASTPQARSGVVNRGQGGRDLGTIPGLVRCPSCTAQFEPGPGWLSVPQGRPAKISEFSEGS